MTISQILDYALPYTREERGCSRKKNLKARKRNELALLLNDYRNGLSTDFSNISLMVDKHIFTKRIKRWLMDDRIENILNELLPAHEKDKRARLRKLIEDLISEKSGTEILDMPPLELNIDFEKLKKRINN